MTRTTPPRPADIAALFPELGPLARTATRLHPIPGAPTIRESSAGGPLLWPESEPWPHCDVDHGDYYQPRSVAGAMRTREILAAAWSRTPRGENLRITTEEVAELDRIRDETVAPLPASQPLVPVAQLRAADVPDLHCPDGADLLQVLWCPLVHPDPPYGPLVELRWRREADVLDVLSEPPQPEVVDIFELLPAPCVLHPERVVEFPYRECLPREVWNRIDSWQQSSGHEYQSELSVAPGWKVGGWDAWYRSGPQPVICECGAAQRLLLTVASGEWHGGPSESWRPVEDVDTDHYSMPPSSQPTQIVVGDADSLWIFTCPVSPAHPHRTFIQ